MKKVLLFLFLINTLIVSAQEEETEILDSASIMTRPIRIISDFLHTRGDEVYIDGSYVDMSPVVTEVTFGRHTISVQRNGNTVRQRIRIEEVEEVTDTLQFELYFGLQPTWNQSVTSYAKSVISEIVSNMVYVEEGTYMMGSNHCDADRDERPAHKVRLSPFFIGRYEITNRQWFAVMANDSVARLYENDNTPKTNINSIECQAFVDSLRKFTELSFMLPTEAQWEYAAKGGRKSKPTTFSGGNDLDKVAWYFGNSGEKRQHDEAWRPVLLTTNKNRPHDIGQKQPNELGIYDMTGNVFEFCSDFFDNYRVKSGEMLTNPKGPSKGQYVVVRGGSWLSETRQNRVTYRSSCDFRQKSAAVGLRVAVY
ncbi:MAG: SUMF1/EgtB/PvdO family nonheme iron enzyme [Bacteroidales bacterium]|nr:SUMF1/EgtB/PvdO family nonheme iron enzyme [Bacteroidales bacterium]